MRRFLIMAALFLLSSCSPRVFPVQRDTVTQVRTEIVERLVRDSIQALVINVLQPLRTALGVEMPVNSGYRCSELNEAVGGVPTSQHVKGEAADIATAMPIRMARKAVEMGLPFDQMGIYPTFVHISHKLGGPQRGQVFYSKDYKGERL